MRRIRRHLTYANVMVTLLAFIVLTGGTAVALGGSNTVFTDDVANDTFNSPTQGQGGLVAADLRPNSVGSSEVANGSLRQADLGVRVRNGRQVDDGSLAATCGQGIAFDECVTVLFDVPRPQRLLLVGSGEWTAENVNNSGECRFSVPTVGTLGLRRYGEADTSTSKPFNFAMNSVTGVVNAGQYEISIDCRDLNGDTSVKRAELSVVAVGDG